LQKDQKHLSNERFSNSSSTSSPPFSDKIDLPDNRLGSIIASFPTVGEAIQMGEE
jgi:hypothetical protein